MSAVTSLRRVAKVSSYAEVVREERFFCAALFHLLLKDESFLGSFIQKCIGCQWTGDAKAVRVFVEYAMARDLWDSIGKTKVNPDANQTKLDFILSHVDLPRPSRLDAETIRKFNAHLVAGEKPSETEIQSPSRWGISKVCQNIGQSAYGTHDLVRQACYLKWGLNVKPDVVLELDHDTVIYIEAKAECGVARYPSSDTDKAELKRVADKFGQNPIYAYQCCVQDYVMRELLGFTHCYPVVLRIRHPQTKAQHPKEDMSRGCNPRSITWDEVLLPFEDRPMVRELRERILSL